MSENTVFLSSLGSGSAGNAFVIEAGKESLIVDQGFSRRELLARMKTLQLDPAALCGALLTHEHSDHSKGTRVFCDTLNLPLYTTARTALYLRQREQLPKLVRAFEAGESFQVGNFEVRSFPLPHDAVDPVGFTIRCGKIRIGIATDLGHTSEQLGSALRGCDVLVLESNYDRNMLMNSPRSLELKRRICGMRGHLGNPDTCTFLGSLLDSRTRLLLLAHVSRECNRPDLIRTACTEKLAELHRENLPFEILTQDIPAGRFALSGEAV